MSGATAKESRREIRRAVGEEALGIIDAHTQAIDHSIIPNINALTAQGQNHENRIRLLNEKHDGLRQRVAALEILAKRGFWGRLRWILTGS